MHSWLRWRRTGERALQNSFGLSSCLRQRNQFQGGHPLKLPHFHESILFIIKSNMILAQKSFLKACQQICSLRLWWSREDCECTQVKPSTSLKNSATVPTASLLNSCIQTSHTRSRYWIYLKYLLYVIRY